MAHALLSPSGASRWMACTPSARLEEKFPESTSTYAEEGTLAHKLAETVNSYNLLKNCTKTQLKKKLKEIEESSYYNAEMQNYIDAFCHYVWETYNSAKAISKDAVIALEAELDIRAYVPDCRGTGDVIIVADGILTVIDLKYGLGVPVLAENNKQMMLYALGALDEYDMQYGINSVKMIIYQPRRDNISEWEISAEALLDWAENELKQKAALAYDGAGDFCPGDHCRFCKARATCRARAEENLKLAAYEFRPPEQLSNEEIADILKIIERLTNWAGDVSAYALDQAVNHNVRFEGWKLVEGRSNRIISNQDEAANVLTSESYSHNDIYNQKLKGIGDLEKLVGKDRFNELLAAYIVKPQGKPTLVPESDRRPEWNSAASAAEVFADVAI